MSLLDWIEAHPVFTSLVLVPVIMGTFNAVLRPRTPEEYAAMNPRVAALLKLLRGWFPEPKKLGEATVQLLTGTAKPVEQMRRASVPPPKKETQ